MTNAADTSPIIQKQAIGQRFGNLTEEYKAANASTYATLHGITSHKDQTRFSCLSMNVTASCNGFDKPKCERIGSIDKMCLDVKGDIVDKAHFTGFCVHSIKGENTQVWFDKSRSRKLWTSDSLSPKQILYGAAAPNGTVFMGEKDAESTITLNIKGLENGVNWPKYNESGASGLNPNFEACDAVQTTVTLGSLEIGKENCDNANCWKQLTDYDTNDMYMVSVFGANSTEKNMQKGLVQNGHSSSGFSQTFQWEDTTTATRSRAPIMVISLSEKAKRYFFDASHQRHMPVPRLAGPF